jgi:hypothetical protein
MTNILDRANKLLNTVEPYAWMKIYPVGWDGQIFLCVKDKSKLSAHPAELYKTGLYSRETVERLLAENTKQTLLKAAEVCKSHEIDDEETFSDIGYNNGCGRCATELRRMAEGEK